MPAAQLQDLESTELAYNRVRPELEALTIDELAPLNVDLVSAASIALGVADRIFTFRDRMMVLPEFDIQHLDHLLDYAKATWYVHVTNHPLRDATNASDLMAEVSELRSKLLMWAAPLEGAELLDGAALARIREGSGHKDTASDLVALVELYRSNWDAVKSICGVTEQDLARGAEIAPAMFSVVSRRENQMSLSQSDTSLRSRRAWTLLDRAYTQCRRALSFLRFAEGDVDDIAPNLRRNNGGPRSTPTAPGPATPAPTSDAATPTQSPAAISFQPVTSSSVGGGSSPFVGEPERS